MIALWEVKLCTDVQVIQDPSTQRSKGFGFVRFADEGERDRALIEMNGKMLCNRAIRVSRATTKKPGDGMVRVYHLTSTCMCKLLLVIWIQVATDML